MFVTTSGQLGKIIDRCIKVHGFNTTAAMLDAIKEMGYKYSTRSGLSISVADMTIPKEKYTLIEEAEKKVEMISKHYMRGELSNEERYNNVVKVWEQTTADVVTALQDNFDRYNPIKMMSDSGARGSMTQMRQLAGMRGLMFDTSGNTMEIPIKSNFREGLNILEYFIAARGARKSLRTPHLKRQTRIPYETSCRCIAGGHHPRGGLRKYSRYRGIRYQGRQGSHRAAP